MSILDLIEWLAEGSDGRTTCSPMSEKTGLDIAVLDLALTQRIRLEENHGSGNVIGGAPVRFASSQFILTEN